MNANHRKIWRLLLIVLILIAIAGVIAAVMVPTRRSKPAPVAETTAATDENGETLEAEAVTEETAEETTEYPVPNYPAVKLNVPQVDPEKFVERIEAEDCKYTGALAVEDVRKGASGSGYLTGFSKHLGDSVKAEFEAPTAQHYDITISVCADSPVTNALTVNGRQVGTFSVGEEEGFTRVTFAGIYLPAGKATLSIEEIDGYILLDYFEVANNTELYDYNYRTSYDLTDPKASAGARKLMKLLSENYGKKLITGQQTAGAADTELELIRRLTGKLPAIRFGDVEAYSGNSTADGGDVIGACERWAEKGGIVGLMWHWDAPTGISSVYAEETDFELEKALPPYTVMNVVVEPELPDEMEHEDDQIDPEDRESPDMESEETTEEPVIVQKYEFEIDVATLNADEIAKLAEQGKISEECKALLADIDSVSEALKPLADADIPVLWRPLHEAGGDWFWWGADGPEAYRWLWDVLYRRMTEYHGLHNLIWVWNAQSEEYLVDRYDIASADIYLAADRTFGSRYEQFTRLSRMTGGTKMIAMSECSAAPDLNEMFRDNTVWSYFGLWYGEYLIDGEGKYADTYTPAETMISLYNCEAALTLDDVAKTMAGQ
ncbi:MAG: hypothetical protein IJ825_04670 [Oscillospiraceae bacterium]|nr:hypothetical protein [Oscillospiraceae bacterium]